MSAFGVELMTVLVASLNINPKSSSKVKRCKAPVLYYANSVKSFNIILCGDTEKNPGPGSHPVKCDTCEKTIRSNSKKTLYRLLQRCSSEMYYVK